MLNLKFIVNNIDKVIYKLSHRKKDFSYLKELCSLHQQKKILMTQIENKNYQQNKISKEIPFITKLNEHKLSLLKQSTNLKQEISILRQNLMRTKSEIFQILSSIPNIPHKSLIENDKFLKSNIELYKWGGVKNFNFPIKNHITLGKKLKILDFQRAIKITGSRFVIYQGLGAKLERALIQFMMDLHSKKGYNEIIPPFIVNETSMFAAGQLPKFKKESYQLTNNNWYLNPTGEIPGINLHRDEILKKEDLPLKYVIFTTCFRQEAGSAGRDTKGILRQHQFNKVELIKFTQPENSYLELDKMLQDAEEVLKKLKLPFRVINLNAENLGFTSAKTYDIEVWLPSINDYREIASISNTETFQAQRANIKFQDLSESKITKKYVHTLNGSGLAIGRTVMAILENYQNSDGTINIPEILQPYMLTKKIN